MEIKQCAKLKDPQLNCFICMSYGHPDFNVHTSVLESESNVLINWFKVNKMQANPDKFQVLAVGKKTFDKNMKICIQNSTLSCEETVKLFRN